MPLGGSREDFMITELKLWVLIGVAGAMSTVLGAVIRMVTSEVIKRLDDIVTELKQLSQSTTIHGQEIKSLQEQDAMIHHRLQEHADRLLRLEQQR